MYVLIEVTFCDFCDLFNSVPGVLMCIHLISAVSLLLSPKPCPCCGSLHVTVFQIIKVKIFLKALIHSSLGYLAIG